MEEVNIKKEGRIFFYLLFALIIFVSLKVTQSLLSLSLMAVLTVILFNPVYSKILWVFKGRHKVATPLTILLVFLTFLIPIVIIGAITINQVNTFNKDIQALIKPVDQPEGQQTNPDPQNDINQVEENPFENLFNPSNSSDDSETTNNEDATPTRETINELTLEEQGLIITVESNESASNDDVDLASTKIGNIDIQEVLDSVNGFLNQLPFVNYEITTRDVANFIDDIARPAAEFFANQAINFAGTSVAFLTGLIVFTAILASLFPQQQKFRKFIATVSPLPNEIDNIYISRVSAMATSMIKGTFFIAIIQGIISGLLLHFAGVKYVLFWTLLSVFLSLIPNGSALIQWPIAIVLLLTGQVGGAVLVILGNLLIVSMVDNFLRPFVVSREATLHPVLVLIGVLGGIATFGFLGFIYGPVIMIFLTTTIEVYVKYYRGK